MGFSEFMSSGIGRLARIVVGAALVILGASLGGWAVVAFVGIIPLFAGIFDICLFAPLFGQSMSGKTIRGQH